MNKKYLPCEFIRELKRTLLTNLKYSRIAYEKKNYRDGEYYDGKVHQTHNIINMLLENNKITGNDYNFLFHSERG